MRKSIAHPKLPKQISEDFIECFRELDLLRSRLADVERERDEAIAEKDPVRLKGLAERVKAIKDE